MTRLVVKCRGAELVTHQLAGDVIMIGRAPLNHIVIDDPTVSAQHAMLETVGDSYRLKDLHSTNGTQINGTSIADAELKYGDKIRFGSAVAIFWGVVKARMKPITPSIIALALAASWAPFNLWAQQSEAELLKQARVTKHQAKRIALARVKGGTIKGAELEKENGVLIWSFDVAQPGKKDVTEVW